MVFDGFFGPEVKEIIRVQLHLSSEKVQQIMLGPKNPVLGFESIFSALGTVLVKSEAWEENPKTGGFNRRMTYQ